MSGDKQVIFDYEPVTPSARTSAFGGAAAEPELDDAFPTFGEADPRADVAGRAVSASPRPLKKENWLTRRGHLLSYLGLFLFTVAVYLRPYELISALSPLRSMAFWLAIYTLLAFLPTQLSLDGNLTARPREVSLLLLLGLLAGLSIPLGADPGNSLEALGEFLKVILMFVVMVNVLRTWSRWRGMFLLLLGTSCYLSVAAINNYATGQDTVEGYRAGGIGTNMFQNPNDMALFLVTIVPVTASMILGTRNLFVKLTYAVCTLLLLAAIMVSYSRGGFLGLVAAGAVMTWKIARRQRVAAFALAVVLIIPLVVLAPGGFGRRLASSFTDSDKGSSVSARRGELKKSIIVSLRYPIFGVGLGNYRFRSDLGLATHNAYTQISAELGLAAAVVYVMFIIAPFRRLRRVEQAVGESRLGPRFRYLAIGLQAGMVGYMVSSFFASVAFLWHIYYLVGLSICLSRLYDLQMRNKADLARGALKRDAEGRGQDYSALHMPPPETSSG